MGGKPTELFQSSLNPHLKVHPEGVRVTSDGGLAVARELRERLGLSEHLKQHLTGPRRGKDSEFRLAEPSGSARIRPSN